MHYRPAIAVKNVEGVMKEWNIPSFLTEHGGCAAWFAAENASISHSYWHYSSYCDTGLVGPLNVLQPSFNRPPIVLQSSSNRPTARALSFFTFRGRSELLSLFMLTYTSHCTRRRAFTPGLTLVTRKSRKIRLVVACLVGQGARPPAAPKPGPVVLSRTPLETLVVDESSISPRTHSYN